MIEIKLEKLSGHAKEGIVGKIHKIVGDEIKVGDALLEIESNKGNVSVKSVVEGKIISIGIEEGSEVKIGDTIATIDGELSEKKAVKDSGNFNYFGNLLKPQKKNIKADVTIIGGGPGGYVAAIQAAKLGQNVVLVEKEKLGGTCLNVGCIPTKCLVRSAEVYDDLNNAEKYGLNAENVFVDIKNVINRKNKIVNQLVDGIKYLINKNNINLIKGMAEIINENTVYVKEGNIETTIDTDNIIIATGSQVALPPISGIDCENVMTSNEALSLNKLPEKLIIIGGGIIGMEFAFIFNSFGVDVSVIEYFDDILAILDEDIVNEITNSAKAKGIKIFSGSKVEEVLNCENGHSIVTFRKGKDKKFISADKVLVATGRKPYIGNIDLEKLGIELNENNRGIKVNEKMQTNIPNIYAIGDVTNIIQLAHVASYQGEIAVQNISGKNVNATYNVVPNAIFTNPEIATVGVSERDAKDKKMEIEIGKFPVAANGKSLTLGKDKGFVKIIKEKATDKVIGGAIIGPHATDLIGEIALAIKNELTTEAIIETIHAHPTTTESIHEAALATEGGAIHFA